jgi:heme exporter protein B
VVKGLWQVVARDLRLALRQRADAGMVVLFFVLTASLFPFGVGPEPNMLARMAAGVIWVTALLAVLLSLERLFLADYEDGSLELLALSPLPLEIAVLAKVIAHWLTTGLPLIAAAPLLALLFHMEPAGLPVAALAAPPGGPARPHVPGRPARRCGGLAAGAGMISLRGNRRRRFPARKRNDDRVALCTVLPTRGVSSDWPTPCSPGPWG